MTTNAASSSLASSSCGFTHLELDKLWDAITELDEKVGGDTSEIFFGGVMRSLICAKRAVERS